MLERRFTYDADKGVPKERFSLKSWVNYERQAHGVTSLLSNEEVERLEKLAQKPTEGWTIPPREH